VGGSVVVVLAAPTLRRRWPTVSAREVECDEVQMVGLTIVAMVAQAGLATCAHGQARSITSGGAL
jgi:hypothetical protein